MIIEPQVLELYVDLLCEYRPQDVCSFIKMNEGYRLEETLQVSHCLNKELCHYFIFLLIFGFPPLYPQ